MKTLRCIYKNENIELHEYIPTLFSPLYCNFELMTFVRRARFLGEYIRKNKYRVYYLLVDGDVVGYCVVTPGGRRLKCSTSSDIVIGPYYIKPCFRGKGFSKKLISLTLKNCGYKYMYAYDWIEKSNTSSIRATEGCGFKKYGELNVVGMLRKLVIVKTGDDYIYRIARSDVH